MFLSFGTHAPGCHDRKNTGMCVAAISLALGKYLERALVRWRQAGTRSHKELPAVP